MTLTLTTFWRYLTLIVTRSWHCLTLTLIEFWNLWLESFCFNFFIEISFFFSHFFENSFFSILFISWEQHYLTLKLSRFWHYLSLTLTRSWHCLTLRLSDTDIEWVLKYLSSENFLISFFFEILFFLIYFLILKKIKETDKNLKKRMYYCLSKQWLIHQKILSYCIARGKIDKKFDFKVLILRNVCSTL